MDSQVEKKAANPLLCFLKLQKNRGDAEVKIRGNPMNVIVQLSFENSKDAVGLSARQGQYGQKTLLRVRRQNRRSVLAEKGDLHFHNDRYIWCSYLWILSAG